MADADHAVADGTAGLNMPALHPLVTQAFGIALCAGLTLGIGRLLMLPIMELLDEDFLVESNVIMTGVKLTSLFAVPAAAMLAFYLNGYRRGKLKSIPIGSHGAPLFLGNRLTIFGHVLGEGDHWIPKGFGHQPVDTRTRPFIKAMREHHAMRPDDGTDDDRGELLIVASAKSGRPDGAADEPPNIQHVPTVMKVRVSGTVQIVDEMLYLGSDEPWLILRNDLEGAVREYVRQQDPIELVGQKAAMNLEVQARMAIEGARYGIRFHSLTVTDIRFPEAVEEAAARYLIEKAQRDAEKYQADTFDEVARKMKATFPQLSDIELRNAVFTAAKMAQLSVNSIEGRGNTPLILNPNPAT